MLTRVFYWWVGSLSKCGSKSVTLPRETGAIKRAAASDQRLIFASIFSAFISCSYHTCGVLWNNGLGRAERGTWAEFASLLTHLLIRIWQNGLELWSINIRYIIIHTNRAPCTGGASVLQIREQNRPRVATPVPINRDQILPAIVCIYTSETVHFDRGAELFRFRFDVTAIDAAQLRRQLRHRKLRRHYRN